MSRRLHSLPKLHYQLETKCSNTWVYGEHSIVNQNALQLGKLGSNYQRKNCHQFERARTDTEGVGGWKEKADGRQLYFNFQNLIVKY